jgi:hypothetical protein
MIKLKDLLLEGKLEYPLADKDDLQSYRGMEGWKGKLVYMSPDKFLRLARPLDDLNTNPESFKNIEHRILNKLPLDFCVLEVDIKNKKVTGHEGRHRATISKKLGIEKIPVLIYTGSNFKRVPEWDKDDHNMIDKSEFKPEHMKEIQI